MKCKVTCVKVWMGLAVSGCVITLILAAIVLSSYSFESVIGPLPCKLHQIQTSSCCYDEDCIYGKQYIYYFSSNSTHCMNKFDLYTHPHNTSVHFRYESACHPSLKSLEASAPTWHVNDSVIFYVNHQCTEWLESSLHTEHVNTNILWIAIILSFVGCSCVSMICGFITMYYIEILTCFVDYCGCGECSSCDICDKYLYNLDGYDSDSLSKPNQIEKKRRLSSFTNSTSESPIKRADRERLKPSPPSPIAVVSKGENDQSRSIHFNQVHMQFALQPPSHTNNESNRNGSETNNKRRARGYSKESQISRLSPISVSKEEFKQFRIHKGNGKIQTHKVKEKQLKDRVYTSPQADDEDEEEEDDEEENEMDEEDVEEDEDEEYEFKSTGVQLKDVQSCQSTGLSDSVHYDNEWYDETASITTKTTKSRKRTNMSMEYGDAMNGYHEDGYFNYD